ncbi:hypothetical protein AMTR_s00011p00180470 [Amborella trichopoda]|uniref:Uncharacterized protein n=1 Tax=Amborella trichopoda TaxID=13333 RepID=W1NGL0_AMBTC|nr:hypothetical protein AMTR_s00011p00180470 [Amborella trichopoda]
MEASPTFMPVGVVGQRLFSSVAIQVLLVLLGKMYPLMHHHAAKRIHTTPRHSFDPLVVDPLAIVLVEEGIEPQMLEVGEVVPKALDGLEALDLSLRRVIRKMILLWWMLKIILPSMYVLKSTILYCFILLLKIRGICLMRRTL